MEGGEVKYLSTVFFIYYARLLHMVGFLLSPKSNADLQLQIIESISPKAFVENSSAQWAIFSP